MHRRDYQEIAAAIKAVKKDALMYPQYAFDTIMSLERTLVSIFAKDDPNFKPYLFKEACDEPRPKTK